VFPFDQFDPELNYGFNQRYRLQALNWTDWNSDGNLWTDTNGNQVVNWGEIDPGEYMRFSYDYNTANVHQLRINRPLAQMTDGVFLALRHVSRSGTVPTTMMTFELNFYRHASWDWLTFVDNSLMVGAGETAEFTATMAIPANTNFGLYNGAVHVTGPNHRSVVPVVANVAADTNTFTIGGAPFTGGGGNVTPYINEEFYGNINWAYLNESGDWRFFFMDAQPVANATSSLLIHDDWPDPIPNDVDTLIYGPTQDVYSANDPDYYGPYTLGFKGGSEDAYYATGRYFFNTATGTTEEWISAPLEPGLHLIAQHNVLFSGLDTSLPFTKTVGTISLSPEPILIQACGPNGTVPITFTNSIALESLTGAAFGLGMTAVYSDQMVLQDDPMNASSASFTQTVTITNGGRLEVQIRAAEVSPWDNDLDLYLLHDADMSGTFDWGTEIIGASLSPGVDEMIRIDFPADGDYMIAVHGAQVPDPPFLFDMTVDAIQGTELSLSGVPGGPVGAGSLLALDLDWSKVVQAGELWQGMVVIGTPYLPAALSAPVYVVPCDPTGVLAEADFSHNGPLELGSTAVFTNSSTGMPPLSYLWDFGDGSGTTTVENPTHLYSEPGTYTVTLTTSNTLNSDTAEQTIYVGLAVTAGFEHNGPVGVGETAVFTNTSIGSEPLTYAWDFGDGGSSTAEHPSHVYTAPGTFTVTLTTTNPLGSDVVAGQIMVGAPAQAGFEVNGPVYVWETAVFSNTSTGTEPLSFLWDFGDGAMSTAENPTHQYAAAGIYTVTLSVTNEFGSDVFVAMIEVREAMLYMPAVHKP
jgi:PKD repeat protein